ncbi:MAG: molybdopterin dinucleotide binding domain-containing protein [Pseudomonadota bacterium]
MDPVPRYKPIPQAPEGFLRLVNGRSPYHSFSRTMNNTWLTEADPVNKVWLSDRVATVIGLKNGDEVELENLDGVREGPVPLKVTPGIRPELVFLVHGWGQRVPGLSLANAKGASDNRLMTRFTVDPETGATGLRVNFVRLVHKGAVLNAPSPETLGIASAPEEPVVPLPTVGVIPLDDWGDSWDEDAEGGNTEHVVPDADDWDLIEEGC